MSIQASAAKCVLPEFLHRIEVAGTREIFAEQQHKQRGGIDAAVISAEGYFAQIRHFAMAHFMQNFPRFRISLRLDGGGLRCGQKSQHASGDVGIRPQGHECGDDAIASERRAEPRGAGVRIGAQGRIRDQHVKVRNRAARHLIE